MRATILAVDDDEDVRNLIEFTLGREHAVRVADGPDAAIAAAFAEPRPDLILLDVEMGGASGYEVCKTLKASPVVADIPVVFVTSRAETRDVVQGFQLGALDYLVKPMSPPVLAARVRTHLELIERRNRQDELLRERGAQLEHVRLELIRRLSRAMEYHETSAIGNRVIRLGHYARALAQAAGARPILCDMLMKAAPLHDIGKVGVPAAVLRKSGGLTVAEREQMQRHPGIGAEIIGTHDDPLLKLARTLAFTHHERWDGSGYPTGAKANEIPWAGRVMAIVDAFESMTVTQFHREPRPLELAAEEIVRAAGKQFDPAMVAAFRKALPEFKRIHASYADQLGDMLNLDFSSLPAPAAPAPAEERQKVDAAAAEALRRADEARAKAVAAAQERLRIEQDLAAAASKDIVTQHEARRAAELSAAREAELLASAKKRIADETAAARLARDRSAAEEKAADLARQRAEADEAAANAAAERAEAEARAADAAKIRSEAERAAADAARLRDQAEQQLEELRAALTRERVLAEAARQQAAAAASGEAVMEQRRLQEELARVRAERESLEEAAARAAAEHEQAAASLEALREKLRLEQELLAQALQGAPGSAAGAPAEHGPLEDEIARTIAEREALAAKAARARQELAAANEGLETLRQAVARESEALAAARKQRADDDAMLVAMIGERAALEDKRPLVIGPPPRPLPRRRAALAAFLLGAALASAAWHFLQPEDAAPVQAKAPPDPAALQKPVEGLLAGEPLILRLEATIAEPPPAR